MTTKTFDSVNLMRELRAKLSQDMEHLTPKERLRFIQEKAAAVAFGRTNLEIDSETTHKTDAAN